MDNELKKLERGIADAETRAAHALSKVEESESPQDRNHWKIIAAEWRDLAAELRRQFHEKSNAGMGKDTDGDARETR